MFSKMSLFMQSMMFMTNIYSSKSIIWYARIDKSIFRTVFVVDQNWIHCHHAHKKLAGNFHKWENFTIKEKKKLMEKSKAREEEERPEVTKNSRGWRGGGGGSQRVSGTGKSQHNADKLKINRDLASKAKGYHSQSFVYKKAVYQHDLNDGAQWQSLPARKKSLAKDS